VNHSNEASVDHALIHNLNHTWPKRAAVCNLNHSIDGAQFDAKRPDYPLSLVPFRDHPTFERLDETIRQAVLTQAWIGYNKRTIMAEDFVVNPAFFLIAESELLAGDNGHFKVAMRQALIDEHYHTLMHLEAIERTSRNRNLHAVGEFPPSVTYVELRNALAKQLDSEQKHITQMCFAIVAEISVNAFLDLLADNEEIQPQNSLVAQRHNRDEYAHGKVLGEIGKVLYQNMSNNQRDLLIKTLPHALKAFVAQDYTMWSFVLGRLNVPGYQDMLTDCAASTAEKTMVRDYSGLQKFAEELNIVEKLDFDFH
jgi:alpha-N-dichloroacetyl-p-aminophenylserinol N-oxygenase